MTPSDAQALLAALPLPALLVGRDQRVVAANDGAAALFGPSLDGRHLFTVMRQPSLLEPTEACLRDGTARSVRVALTGGQGAASYRLDVAPVAGSGVLISLTDLTEQEQAAQMRRDFVANVSHELKTPLTALLAFIDTLQGAARDDAAARARFLTIMSREANRMNRLVADLLSLSRLEAEERLRPTEPVDVAGLAASAISSLQPLAREAGVDLRLAGAGTPQIVPGDADQITQVLSNLIENAVKYGGAGGLVTVTLSEVLDEPGLRGPQLRIDVADRGEGIAPEHIPRLTERFYRIDDHRSREKGGTGLGLAIVKHIVNRHRGRVRIHSEKGRGSTFSVLLPRA